MRATARARVALGLAGALLVSACEPTAPPTSDQVQLVLHADLSGTAATMVVVVVSAPDITPDLTFNIPVAGGVASGTFTVPAGSNRTITLHAYDAGGVETHRGAVTRNIQAGSNPTVNVVLVPLAGDVPINVVIGTFVITVTPGADTVSVVGTAPLTATITGPGGTTVLEPVVWATLNPGIATVARTGDRTVQVTAVAPGATTIVATYGGSGGTSEIIVSATPALSLIATGLSAPLFVTQAPGDTSRLFIVEQAGRIRVRRNGAVLPAAFLDVTGLVSFSGERGLLSMAFHPNYANNGQFFICYTDNVTGAIQVVRYTVSANPDLANAGSAVPILTVAHPTFSNHNGGLIVFGPDGFLYIGLGDGGGSGDPTGNGQNRTTLLGKILRIDVNSGSPYVVPADNPFVGVPPARPEIWVSGLRNPWRFSFDRANGNLYIADVGQGAREEVNVQLATSTGGENYGWNVMEGTICFLPPTGCSEDGLTRPVFDYTHAQGCSITGGYVYRGKNLPILGGHYFYADFCGGWVRSFRYVNQTVVDQHDYTPEFGALGDITSFGEDLQGELYITTQGGSVYRIVPSP